MTTAAHRHDRRPASARARGKTARTKSELSYRWHDLRHSFVSRRAENPHVSEETVRAVSRRMLERYSHIRTHAKRAAILGFERIESPATEHDSDREGVQKMVAAK